MVTCILTCGIWTVKSTCWRVTRLSRSPLKPSQLFVSDVNGSSVLLGNVGKSWLTEVGEWPFYPEQDKCSPYKWDLIRLEHISRLWVQYKFVFFTNKRGFWTFMFSVSQAERNVRLVNKGYIMSVGRLRLNSQRKDGHTTRQRKENSQKLWTF